MTQPASAATLPVIKALLDQATSKGYRSGVLGVRSRPHWTGTPEFTHGDMKVRVVPCESALAVREAIAGRDRRQWLVVLTDRDDEDLGAGVRAHLAHNRLRTPDPWEAVRDCFAATGLDSALVSSNGHRDIALGLLAAIPAGGWPPAPSGVLTRDHAFGAVARAHLAFADPVVDLTSVLGWTAIPELTGRITDLRDLAGDPLTDAVLQWLAGRCGALSGPARHLLRSGQPADCVPLGLVAGLLAAAAGDSTDAISSRVGREGLIRIEAQLGGTVPGADALAAWAAESAAAIIDLLGQHSGWARGEALLARADELLVAAHAEGIAEDSDLLWSGLTRRLASLADAIRGAFAGLPSQHGSQPDASWIPAANLERIDHAWQRVSAHRLAGEDGQRVTAFHAAVRLARWLSEDVTTPPAGQVAAAGLASRVSVFMTGDAWADCAINDAAAGVSDPGLGSALDSALSAAAIRRSAHDAVFAGALASYTGAGTADDTGAGDRVWHVEDLLPRAVVPLARAAPVLLLVLDGMTAGNAAEIISDVLSRTAPGWAEALLPRHSRRAAALAALPTLTEVSRASLLSGSLATGGQDAEQAGYTRLCRDSGLPGAALFHKKPLDSSVPGYAIAADVAAAIVDVTRAPLVTCVLNTIDDALDRSDPGGTEWTATAVKHLLPLLDRARNAGRVVVITSDHGHVVERRHGRQRSFSEISSGRSRPAIEPPGDGEVLVTGERVLLHGGRAVLAVDERLRYGPLKAGYHGGASPAEAVIPVAVLVPGAIPEGTGLVLAPPQEPAWWPDPAAAPGSVIAPAPARRSATRPGQREARDARLRSSPGAPPTLFDAAAATEPAAAEDAASAAEAVASAVLGSAEYAAQRTISGRLSVSDERVRDLLAAMLAAPPRRLAPGQAAAALGVPLAALRGAVLHVQRLLNIDGYPVLRVDADGTTVILDEALLREQFGIRK
jgi:hypothetical protein